MRGRLKRPGRPFLAGAPLLIAHRGGAGLAPENTIAAFRSAVGRWGADILELDLRLSRDGTPVVIHDATVDRTTDGRGPVSSFTAEELGRLDAGYRFTAPDGATPFRGQGIGVPTFAEVLDALPGQRLNVELKEPAVADPFVETVRAHRAEQRVLLATIREPNRSEIRHRYEGPISASRTDLLRFWLLSRVGLATVFDPGVDAFQIPPREWGVRLASPGFVRRAHALNVPVHVWTVDAEAEMDRLFDMGVDGIMTDRPDRLAAVLHRRFGRVLPPGAQAATADQEAPTAFESVPGTGP